MALTENNIKTEILEKVFRTHYQELLSFAWKLSCDYQAARDIVQDVFANAINNPSLLPPNSDDVVKYLYTSIKNRVIDHLRHMNTRENNKQLLAESIVFSGTYNMESDPELTSIIRSCMDRLPASQREVLLLKFHNNLSYNDISDKLKVAVSTVHTHVKRSYLFLRLCIGKKQNPCPPKTKHIRYNIKGIPKNEREQPI